MIMVSDETLKVGLKFLEENKDKNMDELFELFEKEFPKELLEKELKRKIESNEGVYKSK